MFCCTLLYVHSSIAIILMGKRELVALLNLSSWCLVMVEGLFLAVSRFFLYFYARLFVDALWSPAGKGLTSWLSFAMSNCDVITFPWYPSSGVVLDYIDS